MRKLTAKSIKGMNYVDFMALLNETNRPPGGKDSVRQLVMNVFLNENSKVLDVGCNTGFCTFEIAHLAKCWVFGVDINRNMIKTARMNLKKEPDFYRRKIKFMAANGEKLPFKNDSFDLVMSGGSTAFIHDKESALNEYKRVCKTWGFISDICFFYHKKPPENLLRKMNTLMGIDIEPWGREYWLDLYKEMDLEMYHTVEDDMQYASAQEIKDYSRIMLENMYLGKETKIAAEKKLFSIMSLFNKNHKYLSYGVFIMRKRGKKEQVTLFGY